VSLGTLGMLALAFYLIAVVVVAEFARRARRDLTPADHFLAARGLGTLVLFLTLYATAYSGNSMLGFPGEAYRRGYSWVMATGFMMAVVVTFHLLAPRLRPIAIAHGFVTPGDWVRHRFGSEGAGRRLGIAVATLMTVALANYLLAQLTAMGLVTARITEGAIPYWAGVVGLAGIILFYETLGGMRAVAWTDAVQGLLMLVGLAALLHWLLQDSGGIHALTRRIASVRPEAISVPDARQRWNWLSVIVLLGVGSLMYPQLIQRIFAARSARALKRSFALMSFMPLATVSVVTLIGVAAIPRFEHLGRLEADTVMLRVLEAWAQHGIHTAAFAAVVFVGALAAIMSTADSLLLSMSSIVSEDLLGRSGRDPATTRLGKRIAAGVMTAVVVLALLPRLTLWRLIELKMELLIQCVPAFVLALHWPRLRAGPALAGLLAGAAVAVLGTLSGVGSVAGVHPGLLGLGGNFVIATLGSVTRGRTAGRGAER
jgi:Na+/proline symporter